MLDHSEQASDDDAAADARAACTALVPLVQVAHRSTTVASRLPRASSTFVTHLIATIEQVPQTRDRCRASSHDANVAYRENQHLRDAAGTRARQIV